MKLDTPVRRGRKAQEAAEAPAAGRRGPRRAAIPVEERIRLLGSVPLLRDLDEDHLRPLALTSTALVFEPDEVIVLQGDAGDSVFIIVDGSVEVHAHSELALDGKEAPEAVLARLGPGDTVGELALLDGQPRSATCVAVTRARCLLLSREAFLVALRRNWPLTLGLLRELSHRIRMTDALLAEHARDPLTGLGTKRALVRVYQREVERRHAAAARVAQDSGAADGGVAQQEVHHPIAVLFADVDQLRHINDEYGRTTGDEVLRIAGAALAASARPQDVVVRYGGDEFVVLMPGTDDAHAEAIANEVRATLNARPTGAPFTLSFGTAAVEVDSDAAPSLDHLVMLADLRSYREKAKRQEVLILPAEPDLVASS